MGSYLFRPLLAVLLCCGSFVMGQPFTVRIIFEHVGPEQAETTWKGTVQPRDCEFLSLEGWHLVSSDRTRLNTFELKSWNLFERGILVRGTAPEAGRMEVSTNRGDFSFKPGSLRIGGEETFLQGSVRVERLPEAVKLTDDLRDDDYPSIAVGGDGTAWAVWQSYSGQFDEVRISMYDGAWHTFSRVPGVSGDVWRPQVALDSEGAPWVVWSQQVKQNFDLYARRLDAESRTWGKLIRLSYDPLPDFDHHLISDRDGNLWVVWQGFRENNSDIFLRTYDGSEWSREVRLTEDPANDWEPRIAVGPGGTAYVVWDTYRNGNYDIYLRSYHPEKGPGKEVQVTSTPKFEAHASVGVDRDERVWIVWDEAGANWGKDWGPTIDPDWRRHDISQREKASKGTLLYESRNLNLIVLEGEGGRRLQVESPLAPARTQDRDTFDFGQLLIDRDTGRVGVLFHHGVWSNAVPDRRPRQRLYWETAIIFYEGDRWQPQWTMPFSAARGSARPAATYGPDSSIWLIWPNDGRSFPLLGTETYQRNPQQPTVSNIYVTRLPLQPVTRAPVLKPAVDTRVEAPPPVHPDEERDLDTIRSYRTFVHGVESRIVRGDLHRHTELSFDGEGRRDGSLFDFYRYMIDAASMDFGAVTDHNSWGDLEYGWWLIEKSCDLYHVPTVYTTLYGYERSVSFPNGHRNVFHTKRGIPIVSFFTDPALTGPRPGIATWEGEILENDTKLLYESLRTTGGISIPHTSGTPTMGTDWRDNDPDVEPVVEIFQGDRASYETPGAPRASRNADEDVGGGGVNESGFLWNAYRKGYRLGTIASSDHWSTHISYALVYTEEPTRKAIFEAIRRRHTYGATDNIVLDYRIGAHFMGDAFSTSTVLPLQVRAIGTGVVARVEIIKNEQIIYSATPDKREVTLSFLDQDVAPGTSYYYVRVLQEDRQIAWSSPIWVTYQPGQQTGPG